MLSNQHLISRLKLARLKTLPLTKNKQSLATKVPVNKSFSLSPFPATYHQIQPRFSNFQSARFFHNAPILKSNLSQFFNQFNLVQILTTVTIASSTSWVTYKFNESSQSHKDKFEIIKKLQNDIDENWKTDYAIIKDIPIQELQHTLHLYAKIDPNEIKDLKNQITKLKERIASNQRCLQNIEQEIKLNHYKKSHRLLSMKNTILLQIQRLTVYHGFCETFYYRKEKRFQEALLAVDKWIANIKAYETMLKENNESLETLKIILTNAYHHKAKIHRSLAGKDLTHLDIKELELSKMNYEAALAVDSNKIVLSSLGFLLCDMADMSSNKENVLQQSLGYFRKAYTQDNQEPNIQHGLGYCLYKIEKHQEALSKKIDLNKCQEALDAFTIVERNNPNARLFHDRGLLYLLMKDNTKALSDFNQGIALDPNHILLRFERGNLLLKLGRTDEALADLTHGRTVADTSSIKKKYDDAIQQAMLLKNVTVVASKLLNIEPTASITEIDLNELDLRKAAKQREFEDTLKECSKYARKLNPQIKAPRIFISYAWGIPAHEQWVTRFATELEIAGFEVLLDRWFDRKAKDLMSFVERLGEEETDYIVVVGTPLYLEKYKRVSKSKDIREPVVAIEARLINYMIGFSRMMSEKVIPTVLEGPQEKALPSMLLPKLYADFSRGDKYKEILSLVRDMYQIPQRDQEFQKIQDDFVAVCKAIDKREMPEIAKQYENQQRQLLLNWRYKIENRATDSINKVMNTSPINL